MRGLIKAISFDLWFTLIREDPVDTMQYTLMRVNALHEFVSKYKAISTEEVMKVYEIFESVRGFIDHRSLSNMVALALGLRLSPEALVELGRIYDESTKEFRPKVNEEVYEVLPRIKAAGLKIGVTSNTSFSEEGVRAMLENAGLLKYIDAIVSSSSTGFNKPHPKIYSHLVSRLALEPGEVLHVGDSCVNDALGALNAGLKAALYVGLRRDRDLSVCLKLGIPLLSRLSELLEEMFNSS